MCVACGLRRYKRRARKRVKMACENVRCAGSALAEDVQSVASMPIADVASALSTRVVDRLPMGDMRTADVQPVGGMRIVDVDGVIALERRICELLLCHGGRCQELMRAKYIDAKMFMMDAIRSPTYGVRTVYFHQTLRLTILADDVGVQAQLSWVDAPVLQGIEEEEGEMERYSGIRKRKKDRGPMDGFRSPDD